MKCGGFFTSTTWAGSRQEIPALPSRVAAPGPRRVHGGQTGGTCACFKATSWMMMSVATHTRTHAEVPAASSGALKVSPVSIDTERELSRVPL